ncbi:NUDIX hydrolase N-terminal domain-containing protein, partial [uncultured Holdemanella sp.]
MENSHSTSYKKGLDKSGFVEVISYMNDKWVEFAIRIQSIAQAGLQYGK